MPMVIPPWIKAANPAEYEAQGMRIGLAENEQVLQERARQQAQAMRAAELQREMDAQQVAQRFKEVQAAREQQQVAQDQALAEQHFQLAASQAAQKHQAMQQYQAAIASGVDPNEAMLRFGPAMAANTGAAAAIRAHLLEMRKPKTWTEVTMPSGLNTLQSSTGDIRFAPRQGTGTAELPRTVDIEGTKMLQIPNASGTGFHYERAPQTAKTGLTPMQLVSERDRTEKALDKLMDTYATFDLSESGKPPAKASATTQARWKEAKAQADKLRKRLQDLEDKISGEGSGESAPADQPSDEPAVQPAGKPFKLGDWTLKPL